jgi:hypothetical protein
MNIVEYADAYTSRALERNQEKQVFDYELIIFLFKYF